MKKTFKIAISLTLCALLTLSLCSCSVFSTLRASSEQEKIESPKDSELVDTFNTALQKTMENADTMSLATAYNASNADINGEEDAGLLDDAAGYITKLIMEANPGSVNKTFDAPTTEGTLLKSFAENAVNGIEAGRNYVAEAVTNEKGEEITDEEGNVIKEDVLSDNYLTITFRYYTDTVITEEETDEDGNTTQEAVTERTVADDKRIEEAFGDLTDKDAILSQLDTVKDYITVADYETAYTDCEITAVIDLAEGVINSVTFRKNMHISADATGLGVLAEYGDMVLDFDLTKTDTYTFTYEDAQ